MFSEIQGLQLQVASPITCFPLVWWSPGKGSSGRQRSPETFSLIPCFPNWKIKNLWVRRCMSHKAKESHTGREPHGESFWASEVVCFSLLGVDTELVWARVCELEAREGDTELVWDGLSNGEKWSAGQPLPNIPLFRKYWICCSNHCLFPHRYSG